MNKSPDLKQVREYFNQRIQEHGASARGSDWNSDASQQTRFDQLLKVIEGSGPFSLLDYGCGWGALAGYMEKKGLKAKYYGYDILESAIEQARRLYAGKNNMIFTAEEGELKACHYAVESGIFNYRGDCPKEAWTEHILGTLDRLNELSLVGFAANFLTSYSDEGHMREDLYYADPGSLFDHCKRKYSRNVALLHDYKLYDFTIIVRKE